MSALYATDDVAHEADLSTPLHHGVLRYVASDNLPLNIRNSLPAKNDRPFVYVPVGYCHRNKDFVKRILSALDLNLPNMVVVTSETTGSIEEQLGAYRVQNISSHPVAKDWTEQHVREVLAAKVSRLLESVVESSIQVGAWILPDCPRRRNAAAQMVCEAFPSNSNNVAVGLIGLGEDEEDVLFKQTLDDSKVPVGSPVQSVSKLVYDIGLEDGAPCPALTHLVMFESPEERSIFRQELLDLVPDFLVAFGNVTEDAMKSVFENAKAGSPIILLKHSGSNIDTLCKMFRHVNSHINASGDGSNKPIPPMSVGPYAGDAGDLVKLFLNTWPTATYNSKSIVLADPLIMDAPTLQKRLLAAITSAFDLKSGGIDTRLAKRKVLDYAWSLHAICTQHSRRKKLSAENLHLQLVFFTLISITASVLYEKIYGGATHGSSNTQLTVYVLTILLPLYITSLKQESNEGLAMMNWAAFKIAASRIESEILKFRCQVGPYRVEEKTEIALQKPVEAFTSKIKTILNSVSKGNLVEDAMVIPPNFWDFNVDAHMSTLAKNSGDNGISSNPHCTASNDGGLVEDSLVAKESTPLLPTKVSGGGFDEEMPMVNNVVDDDLSIDSTACFVDDKYCPIKTDNYIELRMQVAMHKKAKRIQKMAARNKIINNMTKMITIGSGATAALSLQWAVPIVLGVTASFGTGQEFRSYPRRIELGNDMVMQLNELKLWWMSLSMYQKQLPHNKDKLVLSAEQIIVAEMHASFGSSKSASE